MPAAVKPEPKPVAETDLPSPACRRLGPADLQALVTQVAKVRRRGKSRPDDCVPCAWQLMLLLQSTHHGLPAAKPGGRGLPWPRRFARYEETEAGSTRVTKCWLKELPFLQQWWPGTEATSLVHAVVAETGKDVIEERETSVLFGQAPRGLLSERLRSTARTSESGIGYGFVLHMEQMEDAELEPDSHLVVYYVAASAVYYLDVQQGTVREDPADAHPQYGYQDMTFFLCLEPAGLQPDGYRRAVDPGDQPPAKRVKTEPQDAGGALRIPAPANRVP
uniref:Uncharacterized protein n=1 Tax=Eutreptiella gymnastica TaxID=73025 RepID=A0A7S1JGA9_9EUGL